MKILALLFLALLAACPLCAQEQALTWQQVWQQMNTPEDMDEEAWDEAFEYLQQLSEQPLDLNRATREDLEQLSFLSEQQVMDIVAYQDRYGPMRSMGELRMIGSLDYQQLALLPYFVFVGEVEEKPHFPSLNTVAKYGKHTLTATGRVPFYERKGDQKGYWGYKYRHSLRYEFTYGDYVRAGLLGAQDAGEPFFANRNAWGYDAYTYYIQVKKLGVIDNLVLGKYRLSAGMGLVLNTSFTLGKQFVLQNLGRQTNTLRPHASRSEADYFQGLAATIRLTRPLTLTAFVSHRPIDATLNDDGTAATLVTSGYHRTETELAKKNNTHLTAGGCAILWQQMGFRLGANAAFTSLDRSLEPNRQTLYRRYYAHGDHFLNASVNYAYTHYRFSLNGETATNQDGRLATINSLSYQPRSSLGIVALQRFYSYRYTTLYGHAFSDGGHTQNESGIYLGINWSPLTSLRLMAYADYAYSPWARYQVSQSSSSWDFLTQADWHRGNWNLQGRYRLRLRQKDNETKTALMPDRTQRLRLSASYASPTAGWGAKTQADFTHSDYKKTSGGWMLSEHLSYQHQRWQAALMAGYFHTDDYDSRIYVYERQLQHDFSFPMYYGRGIRLSLYARADVLKNLRLSCRLGHTNYFDRSTISSGLQQIQASHQTDLDAQVRWCF